MHLLRFQTLLLAAVLVTAAQQTPPFTYSLDQGVPCPRGCGQDTLLADAQNSSALRRGQDEGIDAALDAVPEMLKGKLDQLGCPSSGVIVTHNGVTLDTAFAGSARLNRSVPLTIDSGFKIASISKTFATATLFLARDRGFLPQGLDTPLSTLMPAFRIRPPARSRGRARAESWRRVTLRALAMQASGLPRETPPVAPGAKSMRETEARVLAAVANLTQLSEPFEAAHYSNLGLALVGRAVERAAARAQPATYGNATWEAFLKREVLDPLGMHDTGNPGDYKGADVGARARLVDGVGADKTKPVSVPEVNSWDDACGSMHSTFRDMATWMNFLMDRPRDAAQREVFDAVLSPSSRAEMRNSGFLMGDGMSAVGAGTFESAYMRGRWAANKLGCVDGYRSAMTLVPSLGLGVFAVATSTCDLRGDGDAVGFPVASSLIPQVARALADRDATSTASPPPPAVLERVLGSYCSSDPATATTIAVEQVPLPSDAHRTVPAVVLRPPRAAFDYSFVMEYVGSATATHGPNATEWRRVMGPEQWLPKDYPGCTPNTAKGNGDGDSTGLCSISCMRKMARGSGEPVFFSIETEGVYKGKVRMEDAGAGSVCHRDSH